MAAPTSEIGIRPVAQRVMPPRHAAKTSWLALDAARVVLVCILVTLGFVGVVGLGAEAAAVPLPAGGPLPGFP